jgi:hypothetical protein
MMMNGIFNLIHASFIVFLFLPGVQKNTGKDTLRIKTEGPGNHIQIDSTWFSHSPADTVITAGATGEINQSGENNSVEIKTGREIGENRKSRHFVGAPNNKRQITNNNQKTNCKKPGTRNVQRATIKQSGNNNSVKIKLH